MDPLDGNTPAAQIAASRSPAAKMDPLSQFYAALEDDDMWSAERLVKYYDISVDVKRAIRHAASSGKIQNVEWVVYRFGIKNQPVNRLLEAYKFCTVKVEMAALSGILDDAIDSAVDQLLAFDKDYYCQYDCDDDCDDDSNH